MCKLPAEMILKWGRRKFLWIRKTVQSLQWWLLFHLLMWLWKFWLRLKSCVLCCPSTPRSMEGCQLCEVLDRDESKPLISKCCSGAPNPFDIGRVSLFMHIYKALQSSSDVPNWDFFLSWPPNSTARHPKLLMKLRRDKMKSSHSLVKKWDTMYTWQCEQLRKVWVDQCFILCSQNQK